MPHEILYLSHIIRLCEEYEDQIHSFSHSLGNVDINEDICREMIKALSLIVINYERMRKYSICVYDYDISEMNNIMCKSKFVMKSVMKRIAIYRLLKRKREEYRLVRALI